MLVTRNEDDSVTSYSRIGLKSVQLTLFKCEFDPVVVFRNRMCLFCQEGRVDILLTLKKKENPTPFACQLEWNPGQHSYTIVTSTGMSSWCLKSPTSKVSGNVREVQHKWSFNPRHLSVEALRIRKYLMSYWRASNFFPTRNTNKNEN